MARKVFISVLGTGFYNKCRYGSGDFVSSDTRFIQQATLEMLQAAQEWTEGDAIYIYYTEQSREGNYEVASGQRLNPRTRQEEPYTGLGRELEAMQLKAKVTPRLIPSGKDEGEMWQVFEAVYGDLQEGDELYFDMTHGFRYLPMLILVLGNYAKFLLHTTTRSVTYGNFEATDRTTGIAPIADLRPLLTLQEWTEAAADYLTHGDVAKMKALSNDKLQPILRSGGQQKGIATNLLKLTQSLEKFSGDMAFCRGVEIQKGTAAGNIGKYSDEANATLIKPFNPLFGHIKKSVKAFASDEVNNLFASARLCLDYGNYQSAVTLLQEGIVTFFCQRHGIGATDKDRREYVNNAFAIRNGRGEPISDEEAHQSEAAALKKAIAEDELLTNEFVKLFGELTDTRNDFNHAGFRPQPYSVKLLREKISKLIASTERHLGKGEN